MIGSIPISSTMVAFASGSVISSIEASGKLGPLSPSHSPLLLGSGFARHRSAPLVIHALKPSLSQYSDRNGTSALSDFLALQQGKEKLKRAISAILILVQISFPLPFYEMSSWSASSANAVLYSPDTKVPRTGELALRRAIPANSNMKAIQDSLEDISYLLRIPQRKPYGTIEGDVKKAMKIAKEEKESILGSIPVESKEKGSALYASLLDGKAC